MHIDRPDSRSADRIWVKAYCDETVRLEETIGEYGDPLTADCQKCLEAYRREINELPA